MPEGHAHAPDVLLVMPDTRLRALISAQLQEEGYDVLPVSSLMQAFRLLQRGVAPRLIVLEALGLHEYGEDILALMRLTPAPVLLLTSAMQENPVSEDQLRARSQLTILRRPFAISDLVKKVNALLHRPIKNSPHSSANNSG